MVPAARLEDWPQRSANALQRMITGNRCRPHRRRGYPHVRRCSAAMWRMISSRRSSSSRRGQRHSLLQRAPGGQPRATQREHATCTNAAHATRNTTETRNTQRGDIRLMPHWFGNGRRCCGWKAQSHVSCLAHVLPPRVRCRLRQEHKPLDGWKAQPSDAAADAEEEGFATPPCNLPIIAKEHRVTVCHMSAT